jgi:hypothetical protein
MMQDVPDSPRLGFVVRAFPRPMGCCEMQAQKKWSPRPGVSLDHLDRPLAEEVRHVANPLNRDLLLVELACEPGYRKLVLGRVGTMIEIVRAAAQDSEELIVASSRD